MLVTEGRFRWRESIVLEEHDRPSARSVGLDTSEKGEEP